MLGAGSAVPYFIEDLACLDLEYFNRHVVCEGLRKSIIQLKAGYHQPPWETLFKLGFRVAAMMTQA